MTILWIIAVMAPAACFLLGYHIGRNDERQGWVTWLEAKIPRLEGQRP